MSMLAWLVLGSSAGLIASRMVDSDGQGVICNVLLGAVGAFLGGLASSFMQTAPVTGFHIRGLVVPVVGSVAVLAAYHAVARPAPL
jgi:uncharacterized membrane protein YeaQ/YmgE (transglycosylase-associated protein family)